MTNRKYISVFGRTNLMWLILSFFLGLCLFFLWPGSSEHETDIFIPVDIEKIPEGLTVTDSSLMGIELHVRGSESVLNSLSRLKLRYRLDLSGVDTGVKSIPIKKEGIQLPKGASIISINPSFLIVRVENKIKKNVPVIPSFSGKPAAGFLISSVTAKPSHVTLGGPENILGPIDEIMTKPVNVSGVSESFKKEVALALAENLDIISPAKIIRVEISVEEKTAAKKFNDIPVKGKNTRYKYSITPPSINIEVKGPVNALEKLCSGNGIKVYVDLKGLKPGVYVRCAAISLPVKMTLVEVKPKIFTVNISK